MGIDRIGGGVGPLPDSVSPLEEVSTAAVAPVESRPAGPAAAPPDEAAVKPLTGEGETAAPYDGVMTQGEVMKVKLDDRVGFSPIPLPEPADLPEPLPEPADLRLSGPEPTGREIVQEVASQPDPVPVGVKEVIAQQVADRVGFDPIPIPEPRDEKSGLVAGLAAPTAERPDLAQLDRPVVEAGKSEMYLEKGPALRSELFKPRED